MARRDNQGIQIAMIVFILTTLLFMVTTYFGYSSTTSLKGALAEAESNNENASRGLVAAETLATYLKEKIGIEPSANEDATRTQVDNLVTNAYGQGLAPESQTFIGIIQDRSARVTQLAQQLATANTNLQQLRGELEDQKKTSAAMLADAQAREKKAQEDFNLANQEKAEYISKNDASNRTLVDERNAMQTKLDQTVAKTASEVAQAEKERLAAVRRAGMLQDEINVIKQDTPDQYDGRIVGVVAATKTVLLDVGKADGLRPKMTFSVFDAEDNNVRTAKKKASIEVTRVLGDHSSEARITDTDFVNPIVQDDFVYSPIWSPGTQLSVALVGEMDVDQDGRDDRELVRNLITRNGGKIDAEDVNGEIQGTMTVNTRYIIIGQGQLEGKANDMVGMAKDLTIERMSVTELMELLSPPGRAHSVSYNGVLRPGDFAPKPRAGFIRESTGSTSFRKRTPTPLRDFPKRD